MTDKDIIIKIKKVLALSTNNPSVEEGQTAMLLAQKMMMENNITMSDVSVSEIQTKEAIDQIVSSDSRSPWWYQGLASIIVKNFKCFMYISRNRIDRTTSIKFVGIKNDVETARHVYLYAIEVLSYNCKKYMNKNKDRISTNGIKNQYILGFLQGLKDKFEEQVKNNSWGLVIMKDPVVEEAHAKLHLKSARRNITINGNEQDRLNGYKDGRNFQPISGNLT